MTIGITGSTGFIGSYLSTHLFQGQGARIRLLVRSAAIINGDNGAEVIQGDLLSPPDCERFASGVDVIYYLAHVNSPINSDLDPAHDASLNLVPFLNLLHAIRRLQTRPHVVYFSSGGAIYGRGTERQPFRETDPCAPRSSYGVQKLAAEHYLRIAADRGDLTAAVMRIGNAYGTLLPQYRLQGLIGVAVNNVLHGRPIRVFGCADNIRDYVHLEDICVFARVVSAPRRPFDIFNVASGVGHSVADILRMISEIHGGEIRVLTDDSMGSSLVDWVVLDISKALRETGWAPAIDLRSGIQAMMAARRRELTLSAERL